MLRCAVRGNPHPIVTWTYNGQIILGTSKVSPAREEKYGILDLDESGNPTNNVHTNDIALSNGAGASTHENNFHGKVYYDLDKVSLMLIIKNSNRKLPGMYTCHAVNAMGTAEKAVKVQVLGM